MLWDDAYKIGIKEIDDQHIQWIQITEKLLNLALTKSCKQEIINILNDYLQYADMHFKYEENLMKINNYPDIEQHTKQHVEMYKHIKKMLNNVTNDNYNNTKIAEMCDIFIHWLITHIEREDKKYVPFLEKLE